MWLNAPAKPAVPMVVADGPLKLAEPAPADGVRNDAQPSASEMTVSPLEVEAITLWFEPVL